jgi:translation initiation factor eIF-2B subunit epsilon
MPYLPTSAADTCSDLAPSDSDSEMGSDSSDSDSDDDGNHNLNASLLLSQPNSEFESEVRLSLERAFEEGHSVDNAAVELKTLRMASNVELTLVRKAVIASIVDKIDLIEGDAAAQRKAIGSVISRWGDLINRIGGVDGVETVTILQVCRFSEAYVCLLRVSRQ